MPTVPYTKQTWTDGSGGGTPTSAARLTVIENGINDVSFAPCVRVTHNATQSITTGTETSLAFNTERFDQAGNAADTMHDTVTNNSRLTCRYAGVYLIGGHFEWAADPGNTLIAIRFNNTTTIAKTQEAAAGSDTRALSISTLYALAVNDFVELRAFQSTGAGLNIQSSGNYTPEFWMVRVG